MLCLKFNRSDPMQCNNGGLRAFVSNTCALQRCWVLHCAHSKFHCDFDFNFDCGTIMNLQCIYVGSCQIINYKREVIIGPCAIITE